MDLLELILRPFIDFFNAVIRLLQDLLRAIQDLVNSFFEALLRLFS